MVRICWLLLSLLITIQAAGAQSTVAGYVDNLQICENTKVNAQARRKACSAILDMRDVPPAVEARAYRSRGAMAQAAQNYADAAFDFSRALMVITDDANLYDDYGRCLTIINRSEEAIPAFSRAISLQPNANLFYHNRGFAYLEVKNYTEAAKDFQKSVAILENSSTYYFLSTALYELGRYEDALNAVNRSTQLNDRASRNERMFSKILEKLPRSPGAPGPKFEPKPATRL